MVIAGFFGNPKLYNTTFDSGQSSSSIFYNETLYYISNSYKKLSDKYNISMNMPGNQNFFDDLNLNVPLEYLVTPVDERVDIFHNFKDIHYNLFITEALKILDKYKTRCNPNNKKLVYFTDNCTGKFENNNTFGGYECSNEGFWSKKCKPMFCDIEYAFNHKLNKCVLRKKVIKIRKIYKILILVLLFCTMFYLVYKIIQEIKEYKGGENDSNEEELVDISERNQNN